MRARTAVALGIVLGASTARAQTPAPIPGEPLQLPPAPAETAPSPAPDPNASSPAPEAPAAEVPVEPGADAAGMPATDAAALGGEMTEAELLELGLGTSQPAVDTSLRLSGFIDFGMQIGLNDTGKTVINDRAFYIGNLNLYITKNLTETVRTMAEIRFLYLPNGSPGDDSLTSQAIVATSSDYSDFNRLVRWGGVEIERVYLEWSPWRYLTIRGGQYLTPYGVWNVDHGTPTIIPAAKPYVIGIGFFPERQTGLELYGRADAGNDGELGYHVTLSNGTGPASEWKDLDKNKAVGGRLFWEYRKLGELRLGGSAYYGRETNGSRVLTFAGGKLGTAVDISAQWDALALGLDAVWKYRGIHLQWEWVSAQRKYTREGRVQATSPTGGMVFPVDAFSWGTYALAGYRFEWFGVMPYVMAQYIEQPDLFGAKGVHLGLNIRPIDAVALKVQYDHVKVEGSDPFEIVYLQGAWAF